MRVWNRKETTDHFLINYELHGEERDELGRKVGVQGLRTSILLEDKNIIKNTMEYIEKAEHFKLEQ
jgi:hypothetical protein